MHDHTGGISLAELFGVGLLAAVAAYLFAALRPARSGPWPTYRIVLWIAGCFVAAVSVQAAASNHDDFAVHALALVGLGLLAPVLLMLAAPITLALRSLSPVPARRLARMLRSWPARVVGHPVSAAVLDLVGLWLITAGGLSSSMHRNGLLFAVVHIYIAVTGYLVAASLAGVDPNPHRARPATRATVLCGVVAAYGILSISLASHPPAGVPPEAAEAGSMVMLCGGGAVLTVLGVLLWTGSRDVSRVGRGRPARQQSSPV